MGFTTDNVPARRIAQVAGVGGIAVGVIALISLYSTKPINPLIAVASFVPMLLAVTLAASLICLVSPLDPAGDLGGTDSGGRVGDQSTVCSKQFRNRRAVSACNASEPSLRAGRPRQFDCDGA